MSNQPLHRVCAFVRHVRHPLLLYRVGKPITCVIPDWLKRFVTLASLPARMFEAVWRIRHREARLMGRLAFGDDSVPDTGGTAPRLHPPRCLHDADLSRERPVTWLTPTVKAKVIHAVRLGGARFRRGWRDAWLWRAFHDGLRHPEAGAVGL